MVYIPQASPSNPEEKPQLNYQDLPSIYLDKVIWLVVYLLLI